LFFFNFSTLINLTTLDFTKCPLIISIPNTLINLKELSCLSCPLLHSIPSTLINLEKLLCSYCPLLTSIPNTLINLKTLNCSYCPLLYISNKYRKLTKDKSYSNELRIRIWQRRVRNKYFQKLIYQSSLYPIISFVLQYI
jgi:hypothetical protein